MSGMDIGGDESVEYRVYVEHIRKGSICNRKFGKNGFEQGGIDETPDGASFNVGVKIPKDSARFVATLRAAADEAEKYAHEAGHVVRFELPIEHKNYQQIQIQWISGLAPGTKPGVRPSRKAVTKKASKAVAKAKPAAKGKKAAKKGKKR